MGVKRMFSQNDAQLSKMLAEEDRLFVSDAIQKAKIKVTEEGTEAAAATMLSMVACAMMPSEEPESVYFERSFPYFMIDTQTNAALFIGKVTDPSQFEFTGLDAGRTVHDGAPEVYVGKDRLQAPSGSYCLLDSETEVIACGAHPLEWKTPLPEVKAEHGIVVFESALSADQITAKLWPLSAMNAENAGEVPFTEAGVTNREIYLPDGGEYVCELTLEWESYENSGGSASYVFMISGE